MGAGGGRGASEGDYLVKIKSEGVGKWIYADTDTSGGWVVFGRDGGDRGGARLELIGSRVASETLVMQTLISWFCFDLAFHFDPTRLWWGKIAKRLLQRLAQRQKKYVGKKVRRKKEGKSKEVGSSVKMSYWSQAVGGKKRPNIKNKTLMIRWFLLIGCEQRKSRTFLFLCVKSKRSAASGWC